MNVDFNNFNKCISKDGGNYRSPFLLNVSSKLDGDVLEHVKINILLQKTNQ